MYDWMLGICDFMDDIGSIIFGIFISQFYHLSDLHFVRRGAGVLRGSAVTRHHGATLGAGASAWIPIHVLTEQQQEKVTQ